MSFNSPNRSYQRIAIPISALGMLFAAVPGCGQTAAESEAASDLAMQQPDLAPLPPDLILTDLKSPGYPADPTGPNIGDVIPNFTFQGYFSPKKTSGLASAETFGEVSFDTFRTSGAKYAILQTAAFW